MTRHNRWLGIGVLVAILSVVTVPEAGAQLADSAWPMRGRGPTHRGCADAVGPSAPDILWSIDLGGSESGPVLGTDGNLYIGSSIGLMCASRTGTVLWNTNLGDKVYATPAVAADGTVYAATRWAPNHNTRLYAVNPDGTVKWGFAFGTNARVFSSPLIGPDGMVYLSSCYGAVQGGVHAFNPDGTVRWQYRIDHGHYDPYYIASPAMARGGALYVADDNCNLVALNSQTGAEAWYFHVSGGYRSSPAIGADGTIYIGTDDDKFVAINPNGTRKWEYHSYKEQFSEFFSSPAIAPDGTIIVGSCDHYLYAFNPDGSLKWEFEDPAGRDVNGSPMVDAAGNVYCQGSTLFSLTPEGELRWQLPVGCGGISQPILDENGVLYTHCGGQLLAIVPEPATLALLAAGLGALWMKRRRKS